MIRVKKVMCWENDRQGQGSLSEEPRQNLKERMGQREPMLRPWGGNELCKFKTQKEGHGWGVCRYCRARETWLFFFPLTNHGRLIRDFEMKQTCIYYRQTYIPSHLTVWWVKCWYLHFLEEGAGYQGADLQSSGPRQGRSTLPLHPNCRQQLEQGTWND